jgi:hypothetical protein
MRSSRILGSLTDLSHPSFLFRQTTSNRPSGIYSRRRVGQITRPYVKRQRLAAKLPSTRTPPSLGPLWDPVSCNKSETLRTPYSQTAPSPHYSSTSQMPPVQCPLTDGYNVALPDNLWYKRLRRSKSHPCCANSRRPGHKRL